MVSTIISFITSKIGIIALMGILLGISVFYINIQKTEIKQLKADMQVQVLKIESLEKDKIELSGNIEGLKKQLEKRNIDLVNLNNWINEKCTIYRGTKPVDKTTKGKVIDNETSNKLIDFYNNNFFN
jgi:cell division protein FtsB